MERISLYRPLTLERLNPEIEVLSGSDTQVYNGAGDISFTVDPSWRKARAEDGERVFGLRKTLVVVERDNGSIRQVGLVDGLELTSNGFQVSCGGPSMIAAQSGPWEGHQGYYVSKDPVSLFRDVWKQVQSYKNSDLGIRVTGDKTSGSSVGDAGSARYQRARRDFNRYGPELDKWEKRLLTRERTLSQREERMFRAAGLKRVGSVSITDDGSNPPDDPGWKADSTLWIRKDGGELGRWGRAHRWRKGRWISQSQADSAVRGWRGYQSTVDMAKDEVDRLKHLMEPAKELMDKYEENHEGREEYSLYFWQNHDIGTVIEDLTELGPFEFREEATWGKDRKPILSIRVGSPKVGVKRRNIHLELGVNIHDFPVLKPGELFTGVTLFGAGEGSEVLSQQRSWNPKNAVRSILTETDKGAYTKKLTQSAANKALGGVRRQAQNEIQSFVVHHGKACPEGSFTVGDEILVKGTTTSQERINWWFRVLEASTEWGSGKTQVEVERI